MTIWVDADACPNVIKEILYRAAERHQRPVILVANQALRLPPSRWISARQVSKGFDEADNAIVSWVQLKDIVITSDIPLAADVIAKGGQALSPRGELFHPDTIKAKLTMRDLMDTLRASGIESNGPPPLNQADRQKFANELTKLLQQS